MFLLIRENDDLLYKIRFLQKINYPLDQKRVDQILNGRYFLDVFGSSDLLIDGAIYHFCVLIVHSKVNLWKWITLMQEHKYIEHCYIEALGKSQGLAVDEAQKVLQYIHQINMQYGTDDMLCVGEIDEYYSDFANQLIDQYFSLLDIDIYNIDISYLFNEMKEDGESLPETMKEVLDQLDDIPKDVKKIILNVVQRSYDKDYKDLLNDIKADDESEPYVVLNVYIDRNYTKYREKYKKWFKNDKVYQSLDYSSPEYADDILAVSSEILEDGTRCDILQNGYWMERFRCAIPTVDHQYFIDQIKIRKKLNLL